MMSKNPLTAGQAIQQSGQQPDFGAMFQKFRQNPMEYLVRAKLNIPDSVGNDPQAIVQHLMSTGQVPKQLIPQINAMLRK